MDEQWIPERLRASLAALVTSCGKDPAVLATWVGGSLARDTADDWSDIDLHLLVTHPEEFRGGIVEWLTQTMPVVLAGSDPEQLIQAHTAIAREYLARARRLSARLDEPWPAELEQASLDLWHRELGIELD